MDFKRDAKSITSSDIYYDLFEGGYIKPEEMLEDCLDLQNVRFAIQIIDEFLTKAKDKGLIKEY